MALVEKQAREVGKASDDAHFLARHHQNRILPTFIPKTISEALPGVATATADLPIQDTGAARL
jgi:hypothetical protein